MNLKDLQEFEKNIPPPEVNQFTKHLVNSTFLPKLVSDYSLPQQKSILFYMSIFFIDIQAKAITLGFSEEDGIVFRVWLENKLKENNNRKFSYDEFSDGTVLYEINMWLADDYLNIME